MPKLKIVPADRPDKNPAPRRKKMGWPLRFNPSMDQHVAHFKKGHWSCVSINSNEYWMRRDGECARAEFKIGGSYLNDLTRFDALIPYRGPHDIFK